MTEDQPQEYLTLFSNKGSIRVQVKFRGFDGTVAAQAMEPEEIVRLISEEGGGFKRWLTFDEALFEILRYEIDPTRNVLTIRAVSN